MIFSLVLILLLELILFFLISALKKKIPWIITNKDEDPNFKLKKNKNFISNTFNEDLGWDWKAFKTHQENFLDKKININFGKYGERLGLNKIKYNKIKYASFGDSFVFCRFVKNQYTWQEQIDKNNTKIMNFGVGNYGLDQIYLKYKKHKIPKNIKNIFIGFVPETLSRCLCSWKHYHEFNNIYGFKPKFLLIKNNLKLVRNPIKNIYSFEDMDKRIKRLKKQEYFYKNKFIKHKFYFPYLYTFFKNPIFNTKLIFFSAYKLLNSNNDKLHDLIIKKNCRENDNLFLDNKNKTFLKKLINQIIKLGKQRKQKIIFLIFPQKYDLELKNNNYSNFFLNFNKQIKIIDFTQVFKKYDLNKIYLPGKYGGHLSNFGNLIVAKTLKKLN